VTPFVPRTTHRYASDIMPCTTRPFIRHRRDIANLGLESLAALNDRAGPAAFEAFVNGPF
jgi:hypothetical protein